jgi:hypothetical protein
MVKCGVLFEVRIGFFGFKELIPVTHTTSPVLDKTLTPASSIHNLSSII